MWASAQGLWGRWALDGRSGDLWMNLSFIFEELFGSLCKWLLQWLPLSQVYKIMIKLRVCCVWLCCQEHQGLYGTDWRPHWNWTWGNQYLGGYIWRYIPWDTEGNDVQAHTWLNYAGWYSDVHASSPIILLFWITVYQLQPNHIDSSCFYCTFYWYVTIVGSQHILPQHNKRGVVSMANQGPDTNGSQFFITYSKQPHLDMKYTIIGKLVATATIHHPVTWHPPPHIYTGW